MIPNAKARHFLLKAKQRDLIIFAGGIERAAAICSYSKSTVGRWANVEAPELMPLDAIFALEEETGLFEMSEAIASARGRRFAETDIEAVANGSLMAAHADAAVRMGELMTEGALAFADGKVTPAEAGQIDKALREVERVMAEYRKVVAGVRGAGGFTIVGGAA